jgi:MFS family permease
MSRGVHTSVTGSGSGSGSARGGGAGGIDGRNQSYDHGHQPLVRKATFCDDEDDAVIPEDVLRLRYMSAEEVESNYWNMCLAFSINHACANCCLTYASTVLGDRLGSIGNGVLYCVFAFTAAFLSKPFVICYGARRSLIIACFGYSIFVLGFFSAVLGTSNSDYDDSVSVEPTWGLYLFACVCGGLAGGILWTAQGRYFAHSARMASTDSGQPVEQTNNSFAATFAMLYLGSEMVLKLVATLLYSFSWGGMDSDIVVFGVYPCIALLAAVYMMWIKDLKDDDVTQTTVMGGLKQALASFILSFCDLKLTLLLPFQISFGFASSFITYYVFGTIVSESTVLGETYVGLLSAIIMFVGAGIAMPSATLANKYGKPLVMTCGGLALAGTGLICFVFNTAALGTWELIVPLMVVFGFARGTWVSVPITSWTYHYLLT